MDVGVKVHSMEGRTEADVASSLWPAASLPLAPMWSCCLGYLFLVVKLKSYVSCDV